MRVSAGFPKKSGWEKYSAFNPGVPLPIYSEPAGIALNTLGNILFITDFTNNTVWALNLSNNATSVLSALILWVKEYWL